MCERERMEGPWRWTDGGRESVTEAFLPPLVLPGCARSGYFSTCPSCSSFFFDMVTRHLFSHILYSNFLAIALSVGSLTLSVLPLSPPLLRIRLGDFVFFFFVFLINPFFFFLFLFFLLLQ